MTCLIETYSRKINNLLKTKIRLKLLLYVFFDSKEDKASNKLLEIKL